MTRSLSPHNQSNRWRILLVMFFSSLPILSAAFAICCSVSFVLIFMLLVSNYIALAGFCFFVLLVILAPILGAFAYRFSARAFPLKVSGEPNIVYLRFTKLLLIAILAVGLGLTAWEWTLVLDLMELIANFYPGPGQALQSILVNLFLFFCAFLQLFFASLIWSLIKVIKFHKSPKSWASQGFILFLRSFGEVSDSAALRLLILGSGFHSRVALLSSPKEIITSWDPASLAVAGFSFRHPFHSVPIYLESTESSWAEDVRHLATSANLVVIDISHRSPGLSLEIEILNELGIDEKTIKFEEILESDVRKGSSDGLRGDVVFLERSPFRRRISQTFTFTFTYLGFLILTVYSLHFMNMFLGLPLGYWSNEIEKLIFWTAHFLPVVPAIFCTSVLSPAAGFTRRSSAILVRAIQQKILCRSQTSN